MSQLVLIGYRCVGKSTVARHLAARLGRRWIDADSFLEERSGRSIREIFANDGEASFRDMESEILDELLKRDGEILALGGGVILREANRCLLREHPSIWLRADADTIYRRLRLDPLSPQRRPSLTDRDEYAEIVGLLRVREPFYRQAATHIVDTPGKTPDQIVAEIVSLLESASDLSHPP